MVYEIRVRKYMGIGSTSLNKFYRSRENAEKYVIELNKMLDLYYINEIELEDDI